MDRSEVVCVSCLVSRIVRNMIEMLVVGGLKENVEVRGPVHPSSSPERSETEPLKNLENLVDSNK